MENEEFDTAAVCRYTSMTQYLSVVLVLTDI